jgi:hypothetical protein
MQYTFQLLEVVQEVEMLEVVEVQEAYRRTILHCQELF